MRLPDLTLREVEIAESKSGLSITAMQDPAAPKAKMMAALAWVIKKRVDPAFTWDQALDLTMDQVGELLSGEADPLP